MSCPDYLISELGRRGIGVIQPQSGLDYPFVAPSADVRYLVADMQLSIDDLDRYTGQQTFKPPFAIKNLYGVGCVENTPLEDFLEPAHTADVLVVDATGSTVFDSTADDTVFDTHDWGDDYIFYTWQNTTGSCSMLVYKKWASTDADKRQYDKYLTPQNAKLDQRAIYVLPKRLLSLRVGDGQRFTGNFVIKNGYNTELLGGEETVSNFVTNTPITVAANAGTGLGKYSTCGDDPAPVALPIKKINGVPVETGDFLLSATDCLYARRPTKKVGNDVFTDDYFTDGNVLVRPLSVGAVCEACCKCDDYVDLALKINQYRSQYANIGARINEVKQIHEQNIQKWIDERSCGLQNPLRLLLVPQRCPYMDVVLMVCNPCTDCLYSKELRVELEPSAGVDSYAEVVRGYTALFAANSNGRPVPVTRTVSGRKTILTVQFPIIKSSDSAYIRFRVKFSVKSEYAVTGTLTGTLIDNTPILAGCYDPENQVARDEALAVATQALYCDANGETNLP